MVKDEQFLDVVDCETAMQRWLAAVLPGPLGDEITTLASALGRVLAGEIVAAVDVPAFDRSNLDGFAVRACDTFEAAELQPRRLRLAPVSVITGQAPRFELAAGSAAAIATGGMLPRGADAVVMIEHAERAEDELVVRRAVAPGTGVTFAGTDIARGEVVLRRGECLTSRETGVLAALGVDAVSVWRRPRIAVISTGDELIAPGQPIEPACVYDSNSQIMADAVREAGGDPLLLGIVPDNLELLRARLREALHATDLVLLSGGTSKGEGDLCYRAVRELTDPGIVAHGVALKPGKPLCLAASGGKGVAVLPGFPTSAIFTFHEFVAPVIRLLAGRPAADRNSVPATLAVKVNSEIGRTEFLLVGLVPAATPTKDSAAQLAAYPLGKGSGSVTAFRQADGFITIGRHEEILPAGTRVQVQLLSRDLQVADLVVIGSQCSGLDWLLSQLHDRGVRSKFLALGSLGGLNAARRGECDLAGMHLLDPATGIYNQTFATDDLELVWGYGRRQGVVFRPGDARFEGRRAADAIAAAKHDGACRMINRNQGSGTRILIDQLLQTVQPPGYAVQAKGHNTVAAAIMQGRADWGVAIETVARQYGLGFEPLADEQYDFVIPRSRIDRPAVVAFRELLREPRTQRKLREMGFSPSNQGATE